MTDRAPVDVLVPFWGDPALLRATVESVRTQSDPDWRLTVVDDCYPDESVAEYFAAERDPRIRYLRNETNLGITDNYRRCVDLAEQELMMFLGCDDLMHPDFLATVRSTHERFPDAAVIQVGVEVVDEAGAVVRPLADRVKQAVMPTAAGAVELGGEALAASLLHGNWLYWPSLVFRAEALRRQSFLDDLPIIQDLAVVIDMVAAGEQLALEPHVCFSYRRHAASASGATLLTGRRLPDERRYYALAAEQMRALGWHRAERAARLRWTSRLHGLSLVPEAVRRRRFGALRPLLGHGLGR